MKVLWLLKTQSKFLLPLCLVLVMIYNPRFGKAVQLTALILLSASFVLIKFKKDSIRERISEFLKPEKEDIESSFEKNKQVNYDFNRSGSMVHTGNNKVRQKGDSQSLNSPLYEDIGWQIRQNQTDKKPIIIWIHVLQNITWPNKLKNIKISARRIMKNDLLSILNPHPLNTKSKYKSTAQINIFKVC